MKKLPLILSIVALVGVVALLIVDLTKCSSKSGDKGSEVSAVTAESGAIVYFNLDRVIQEYDMANDLRSVVETKANSITEEVNRRGSKLEKDINAFQDKINKGLMTQSVATIQAQKLDEQRTEFQNYTAEKQQEITEEQSVMMNQIADAINNFVKEYNATKQYAMILATQGDILPAPVVNASAELDITDDLLEGLNAAYVKEKNTSKK